MTGGQRGLAVHPYALKYNGKPRFLLVITEIP